MKPENALFRDLKLELICAGGILGCQILSKWLENQSNLQTQKILIKASLIDARVGQVIKEI